MTAKSGGYRSSVCEIRKNDLVWSSSTEVGWKRIDRIHIIQGKRYSFSLLVGSFQDSIRILCGYVWMRMRNFVPHVRDFLFGVTTRSRLARSGAISDIPSTTAARGLEVIVIVTNHFDTWATSVCDIR